MFHMNALLYKCHTLVSVRVKKMSETMVYYNMEAEVLSLITFLHSVYCALGSKEWNNGMATKCTTVKAVTEITRPLFIYVCVHRHEAHALYFCKTQGQVLFSHIQSVFIYNKQLVRVGKRSYFSPPTWLEMSQCLTETIQQVWMLKSCLESQWTSDLHKNWIHWEVVKGHWPGVSGQLKKGQEVKTVLFI